jgi:hypothetical protein
MWWPLRLLGTAAIPISYLKIVPPCGWARMLGARQRGRPQSISSRNVQSAAIVGKTISNMIMLQRYVRSVITSLS